MSKTRPWRRVFYWPPVLWPIMLHRFALRSPRSLANRFSGCRHTLQLLAFAYEQGRTSIADHPYLQHRFHAAGLLLSLGQRHLRRGAANHRQTTARGHSRNGSVYSLDAWQQPGTIRLKQSAIESPAAKRRGRSRHIYCIRNFTENRLKSRPFSALWANLWLGGRVVMQRTATPCTPVRFRP